MSLLPFTCLLFADMTDILGWVTHERKQQQWTQLMAFLLSYPLCDLMEMLEHR